MSIDFLILDQIKKLETEAEYYEKKERKIRHMRFMKK